jgi:hypothetical protein
MLGRVDLILPLGKYLVVNEWKVIQIDYLEIGKAPDRALGRIGKASILGNYAIEDVLRLKFSMKDNIGRAGKTIQQWIENDLTSKLKDYITSAQMKKKLKDGGHLLRAHLVVVVGARHILMWEMNDDGNLVGMPHLAGPGPQLNQIDGIAL